MLLISETGMTLRFPESWCFVYVMQGKCIFSFRQGKVNLFWHILFCLEQYGRGLENKVTIAASSMSIHFLTVQNWCNSEVSMKAV